MKARTIGHLPRFNREAEDFRANMRRAIAMIDETGGHVPDWLREAVAIEPDAQLSRAVDYLTEAFEADDIRTMRWHAWNARDIVERWIERHG